MPDYIITLKAKVDFSGVDPAILSNARLQSTEYLAMVYRFYSPVNQNPPGATPGLYEPGKILVETRSDKIDGLNEPDPNGVGTGICYVNDNTFSGSYDHIGFHFSTRQNQSSSPFGQLDSIQFEFRTDASTLNSIDLPTDHNPLMANHTYTYLLLAARRNPPGAPPAGLDWFFGNVMDSAIDIDVR